MAIKSTIYKAELQIADIDRGYYADHSLTIARHPSETDQRMMIRLLAFARHASDTLMFCKGISDTDEPDLWALDLTGSIELWIEAGLPDERRIGRACGRAREVAIYAYGSTAEMWWKSIAPKTQRFRNLSVILLPNDETRELAAAAQRTMRLQVTLHEGQLIFSGNDRAITIEPVVLRSATRT